MLAAAAVVAAGFWFARSGNPGSDEPGVQASRPEPTLVAPAAQPVPAAEATPAAQPAPAAEPALSAPSEASAASPVGVEAPSAGAPSPAEAGSASPAELGAPPAASAEASSGKIVVILNVRPPHARIYYRGKEAGKAPLRVELEPGKRRSFEVGSPGFMTRKIVVDGSKPELLVGLRPASPYAPGAAAAPP